MTLTELRYIVVLSQERNFRRAAALCHVSQPTLSIAVKKLEEDLGAALFERAKAQVRPTSLGWQVIERAQRMLEQAADIRDLARSSHDQLVGPLALGTLPTIGPYLLPQFIPLLQRLAEHMPLYVEEDSASGLVKKLRHGDLDALVVTAPFQEADVVTQVLFDEPFVLLMPSKHPLSHKRTILASDLASGEMLLPAEGHCFRSQVLAAFPELEENNRLRGRTNAARANSLETLRHMVASGLGVAILPMAAAVSSIYAPNLLVTRPFADPAPSRQLLLAWRASFPRHKAIDVLRRAVQACSPAYWRFSTEPATGAPGVLVDNSDW